MNLSVSVFPSAKGRPRDQKVHISGGKLVHRVPEGTIKLTDTRENSIFFFLVCVLI